VAVLLVGFEKHLLNLVEGLEVAFDSVPSWCLTQTTNAYQDKGYPSAGPVCRSYRKGYSPYRFIVLVQDIQALILMLNECGTGQCKVVEDACGGQTMQQNQTKAKLLRMPIIPNGQPM